MEGCKGSDILSTHIRVIAVSNKMLRNCYHMCSKSHQRDDAAGFVDVEREFLLAALCPICCPNSVAILVVQGQGHHVVQHIGYRCQLDCVHVGLNGGEAFLQVLLHKAMHGGIV